MADRKKALLEKLENYYKDEEDVSDAALIDGKELNLPMDVLRLLVTSYGAGMSDILAEFSFLPVEGDEVWFFSSILTIMIDVPKDAVAPLSAAIAKLNFVLPYGAFSISTDGTLLSYKSVTALRADRDDEMLYQDMELASETTLLIPENFVFALEQIAAGELVVSDFIKMISQ